MNQDTLATALGASPAAAPLTLQAWMHACAAHVEEALAARLPGPSGQAPGLAPDRLHEAMRYAVLGGGKRVRPLLVYAAGELVGADARVLDGAACAVELIHVYSLVHDDMPAMDNDDMRRGKPTVHRQYGEAMAMLVGDALQALAFEVLVAPLVEGDPQSRPQLEAMHRAKTGAMLSVSVELGLLAGGQPSADLAEAMQRYGRAIGLAFQVVDDILDVTADSATLGKTAGKDQAQDKPTYVSLLGLEGARALAADLHAQAHACLQALGPRADRLRMLADFIVERLH